MKVSEITPKPKHCFQQGITLSLTLCHSHQPPNQLISNLALICIVSQNPDLWTRFTSPPSCHPLNFGVESTLITHSHYSQSVVHGGHPASIHMSNNKILKSCSTDTSGQKHTWTLEARPLSLSHRQCSISKGQCWGCSSDIAGTA